MVESNERVRGPSSTLAAMTRLIRRRDAFCRYQQFQLVNNYLHIQHRRRSHCALGIGVMHRVLNLLSTGFEAADDISLIVYDGRYLDT